MQTRQPKKRVNWIFVGSLIVAFPLILFILFMMNVLPPHSRGVTTGVDTVTADTMQQHQSIQDSVIQKKNDEKK